MRADAAAQHNERTVQDHADVVDGLREHGGRLSKDRLCLRIAIQRIVEYLGGIQLFWQRCSFRAPSFLPLRPDALAANHALQWPRIVGFSGTLRYSRPQHVADFAGSPAASAIEPAVEK